MLSFLKHETNDRLGWLGAGNSLWQMPQHSVPHKSKQQDQALAFPFASPQRVGTDEVPEGLLPRRKGAILFKS